MAHPLALVFLVVSLANALKCPYSKPSTLVADAVWCKSSAVCVVDSVCSDIRSVPSSTWTFSNVAAVGNLANYSSSVLKLENAGKSMEIHQMTMPPHLTDLTLAHISRLDLTGIAWPPSLQNLHFINVTFKPMPLRMTWPMALDTISFTSTNLDAIPANLPSQLKKLSIVDNLLSSLVDPLPAGLNSLNLSRNRITEIRDLDLRSMTHIDLSGNPLHTIANVQLSPQLTSFSCFECPLSNLAVDSTSYRAFLHANQVHAQAISFFLADCAGEIKFLNDSNTTICVVDPPQAEDTTNLVLVGSGLALLLGVVVCFILRCCKRRAEYVAVPSMAATSSSVSYDSFSSTLDITILNQLKSYELEQPQDLVIASKLPLAVGTFAEIWTGQYRGEKVAVKRIKRTQSSSVASLLDEIQVLARLDNEYIVHFIGANGPCEYVMEFMDMGDLRAHLATRSPDVFGWPDKINVMLSIVHALVYLHDTGVVHRDLKSKNILLDSRKGSKVADFGEKPDANRGAFQWLAPEVLAGNTITSSADIYSFGVIVSELSTHMIPYVNMKRDADGKLLTPQRLQAKIIAGTVQPSFDTDIPAWVHTMALKCLATQPDARPTASDLLNTIKHFKPMESKSHLSKRV
ncbi:hypothetical protein AC1031_010283 [Aphanomyces cochlioides]|nr:hypothetical protein AC1031_010283 [Aphanomyces cochlioides]